MARTVTADLETEMILLEEDRKAVLDQARRHAASVCPEGMSAEDAYWYAHAEDDVINLIYDLELRSLRLSMRQQRQWWNAD